jgi:hypothetical protein
VAVSATFRLLYVFVVVIHHGSRRLVHVNVTSHPSAQWTLQQLREVTWRRRHFSIPDSRPGQHLRETPGGVDPGAGAHGAEIATTVPEGERDL